VAGYEVPVHADIPHQEVIFLDETDPISSPMKAKGVGELGICGIGAGPPSLRPDMIFGRYSRPFKGYLPCRKLS
jgi:hypothetical protein